MKPVCLLQVCLALLVPLSVRAGEGAAHAAAPRVCWDGDVCSYSLEGWELRITYLMKGTRSEGQDGVLLKHGEPVAPTEDGALLDTPLGQLKHYGKERKVRWAITGWNFATPERVMPSAKVNPTVETQPEPPPPVKVD